MRWRSLTAAVALLMLAGCSSSGPSGASRTAAPSSGATTRTGSSSSAGSVDPCVRSLHARPLRVPGGPAFDLIGAGRNAVIFSNESDQNLCSWVPFVKTLKGYTVALFDFAFAPPDDITGIATHLRRRGARTITLIGASEGAKASLVAAATVHPARVVSLSAEARLRTTDVAPFARKLTAPTLFVIAADDPYGSTQATKSFYRSDPARGKRLVVVPGDAHGTALLKDAHVAAEVRSALP